MIKTDSHYTIGQSHLYVQDYALAANESLPYIIVSDGCSSAQHADIGARLIALAARHYLLNQMRFLVTVPDARTLANNVAWRAHAAAQLLGVSHTSIDATLLLSFVKDHVAHVYVLGDGVIAVKQKDQALQLIAINYSHNAPYYPAYLTNESRRLAYRDYSAGELKTVDIDGHVTACTDITDPGYFSYPVDSLESIFLATDGVQSFINTELNQLVPLDEVMHALTSLKNTTDAFIKRRMKRALKDWSKVGIVHNDDVAMAAMVFDAEVKGGAP
jgi:hypothetical protein